MFSQISSRVATSVRTVFRLFYTCSCYFFTDDPRIFFSRRFRLTRRRTTRHTMTALHTHALSRVVHL
jgi:hypothetical protein